MGKDKRGTERLHCKVEDCDCDEYERPDDGHDCEFCGCKPAKHARAEEPSKRGHVASEPIRATQQLEYRSETEQNKLNQELYSAARSSNYHKVVDAIAGGANVNYQDSAGWTPLRAACYKGNFKIVKELLTAGADKNIRNNTGWTPLNTACYGGYLEIVEELIRVGANIHIPENDGRNPAYIACQKNHLKVLQVLKTAGANVTSAAKNGKTPLEVASRLGFADIVQELQKNTASVENSGNAGTTASEPSGHIHASQTRKLDLELYSSARSGDYDGVIAALHGGANVDYQDPGGWTPLRAACVEGNIRLVRKLIEKKANMDIPTKSGWTPLNTACSGNHLDIVEELIRAGANRNIPDNDGRTPVYIASQKNNLHVLQALIKEGTDINIAAKNGVTPLRIASRNGFADIVKALNDNGANAEIPDNDGFVSIHKACQYGHYEVAKVLLEKKCNLHPTTNSGETPLHLAAYAGKMQLGKLLLDEGHSIRVPNYVGETPLDYAQQGGHVDFRNLLMKREEYRDYDLIHKPAQVKCLQRYEEDVERLIDQITTEPEKTLRRIKTGIHDVHYQDLQGKTALHYAAEKGDLVTATELVDFGCIISPVSLSGQTPADIALKHGHHNVYDFLTRNIQTTKQLEWIDISRNYLKILNIINRARRDDDKSDLDAQKDLLQAVRDVSSLLNKGTPIIPPGNIRTELIFMSIFNNISPPILELFLSAGAPIYQIVGRHNILHMVWLAETGTTREAVMVTRRVKMQLQYDLQKMNNQNSTNKPDILLRSSIRRLLGELDADDKSKPWKASWKLKNAEGTIVRYNSMSNFLVRSCELGLTSLSWWIWQSGVNTSLPDENNQLPLLAAIANQHWNTVKHLVRYMSANPLIKSPSGQVPLLLMPEEHRQEILQGMVMVEFISLDKLVFETAKDPGKNLKMKKISMLLACLYVTFTAKETETQISWNVLYSKSVALLTGQLVVNEQRKLIPADHLKTNNDKNMANDQLIWVKNFIQNIYQDQTVEDDSSLPELVTCLKELINIVKQSDETPMETEDGLESAIEVACEKGFPLFLYFLIDYIGGNPNTILDTMLETKPLHHAAANDRTELLLYLQYSGRVHINAVDRSGNTAAHIAFMRGNTDAGDLLIHLDSILAEMKNSSGKNPLELKNAYLNRIHKVDEILKEEQHSNEAQLLFDEVYDQHNEYELTSKHMELLLLKKQSKRMSFRDIAMKELVHFEKGEAREITQLVIEYVQKINDLVGKKNVLYKGRIIPLGSAADNVRLGAPDEADFNIILIWEDIWIVFEDLSVEQQTWKGYSKRIRVKSKSPKIKHLLDNNNQIDGYKFRQEFFDTVMKVIPSMEDFKDKRLTVVYPGLKRTGVGAGLTLAWTGIEYPLLLIDIDLVPVLKAQLPEEYCHPTLTKHLFQQKENFDHEIILAGEKWIFSSQDLNVAYVNAVGQGSWRFSMALLENYFMRNLSTNQKEVYTITKFMIAQFKSEGWFSKDLKERFSYFTGRSFKLPAIQGFLLKTAFFLELEKAGKNAWEKSHYLQRIRSIFLRMAKETDYQKKLIESLSKYQETNVIKGKDDVLTIGRLNSYFAPDTQKPTSGFLGHIIYELLEKLMIKDFIE